jgi:hypothetical protein
MALIAPRPPVEHPADLVIDVFGTFLGKRSERMVVRWRDGGRAEKQPPTEPTLVRFPGAAAEEVSGTLGSVPETELVGSNLAGSGAAESLTAPSSHWAAGSSSSAEAARGLLELWADESEASTIRMSPSARLREKLDQIADDARGDSGEWRERLVPFSRLRSVTVSGRGVTISSDLIASLVERGIALSFLSGRGSPVALLSAPGLGGTVQTRRSQLAAYDSALGVQLAVTFVRGKLRNQQHQLQYSGKYLKATDSERFARLEKKVAALKNLRRQLDDFGGDDLDSVRDRLMGFEGTGARLYSWSFPAGRRAGRSTPSTARSTTATGSCIHRCRRPW